MQDNQENVFKIICVGEPGVGKSSIVNQFVQEKFNDVYNVTIGVEFASKNVQIEDSNTYIQLQIWDTAGQEQFKAMIRSFYRNSAAVFLVYNIAKRDTFLVLDQWLKDVRENSYQDIVAILIGNQNDRFEERQIQYEEGVNWVKSRGASLFFETSASSGDNIIKAFNEMAKIVYTKYLYDDRFRNNINPHSTLNDIKITQTSGTSQLKQDIRLVKKDSDLNSNLEQFNGNEKPSSKGCC